MTDIKGPTVMTFSNAQLERYRYQPNVPLNTIFNDRMMLQDEWSRRVQTAIRAEADATNGWSLLWKMEAAYETVDNRIDQLLVKMMQAEKGKYIPLLKNWIELNQSSPRSGGNGTNPSIDGSRTAGWKYPSNYLVLSEDNQVKALEEELRKTVAKRNLSFNFEYPYGVWNASDKIKFLEKQLNTLEKLDKDVSSGTSDVKYTTTPVASVATAAATTATAIVNAALNINTTAASVAANVARGVPFGHLVDIKEERKKLYSDVDLQAALGERTIIDQAMLRQVADDLAQRLQMNERITLQTRVTRTGGYGDRDFYRDLADLILWDYERIQLDRQSETMFQQLISWTQCDGKLHIPSRRPPAEGFNHLSARVVEWIAWPFITPAIFPVHRQVMLYGPAGSGKTIIAQLAAFDIAKYLKPQEVKGDEKLNDYVVVYYIDAMRLRANDPEVIGIRLKNYLNCLQYSAARDKIRQKRKKMAIAIIDNLDALFMTADELRKQPRPERKSNQVKSWIYKASPDMVAKFAGGTTTPISKTSTTATTATTTGVRPPPTTVRLGGDGTTTGNNSGQTGRSIVEVITSILSAEALAADWPDVRVIWTPRYAWRLPSPLLDTVKLRQLFVDLPPSRVRRAHLERLLRDELYTNVAQLLIETNGVAPTTDGKDKPTNDPDQTLFDKERRFVSLIARPFWSEWSKKWMPLPVKPLPGNVVASLAHQRADLKRASDEYIALMAPVLDFLTTATGMSLEGFCKLQTDFGLSFSEVDMFLITTGKKRDGFAGATPFGYTLEDLNGLFAQIRARVNNRNLKRAFDLKKAFVLGSTRFASDGCQQTAAEFERKRSETGSLDQSGILIPADGERDTCKIAVGPELKVVARSEDLKTTVRTDTSAVPAWSRYGSHRILKVDDAMSAVTAYDRLVTPKHDYPEFVTYVLYRVPKLNRAVLPHHQVSQMCRVRPGPVSTFLNTQPNFFMTPIPKPAIGFPPPMQMTQAQWAPWQQPQLQPQYIIQQQTTSPFQPQFQPQYVIQQPQQPRGQPWLYTPLPRLAGEENRSGGGNGNKPKKQRTRKGTPVARTPVARTGSPNDHNHLPIDAVFELQ